MRGICCSLYPLWLRRHLTFFPQRPIPYPFHLGRLSAYSSWHICALLQCGPKIICLLIITFGIFIRVALYHMWIRVRTLTAPKVAPLCSKVQNVSEFEGGDFLKSKQKYWGTLILNNHPTLKHLLFKNEYFWCKNITLGKRGEILHYDIHKK